MTNTNNMDVEMQLAEIENEIKKAENAKGEAIILMVISIFLLWPLLFVGVYQYGKANRRIEALNEEKNKIIFQQYSDPRSQAFYD